MTKTKQAILPEDVADKLAERVVVATSWVVIIGCATFVILQVLLESPMLFEVSANVGGFVLGIVTLWLYRSGKQRLANWLLIWVGMFLIQIAIMLFGGMSSPLFMYYPFLITLSGWLLGFKPTIALSLVMMISVLVFYNAEELGIFVRHPPEVNIILPVFYFFILLILTMLTLFSRQSLLNRIKEAMQATEALMLNQAELRKLSQVVEQNPNSVAIFDNRGRIEFINQAFSDNTGYSRNEIIGSSITILRSAKSSKAVLRQLHAALAANQLWRGEIVNKNKDGSETIEYTIVAPLRQEDGLINRYSVTQQDITAFKKAREEIHHLAYHDWLTGLPNRASLLMHLKQSIEDAQAQGMIHAIMLLNVDRFRNINDAYGHALGDAFLKVLSDRLDQLLRPKNTLIRLDADQFVILLEGVGSCRESALAALLDYVSEIENVLGQPFDCYDVSDVRITVSIGIALFPDEAVDSDQEVLRRVNMALHQAKVEGGARTVFYDAAMSEVAKQRFRIERELRVAVADANEQLRLYLQPKVDSEGGVLGAEVLVRWQHPEHGIILPGVFIPIAEESSLIVDMGVWVMTEACKLIASEAAMGHVLRLAVNVSPRHFRQAGFVLWLKRVLVATAANPEHLTLEVTEGLVIDDIKDVASKMEELIQLGIHFALDDFGTGYSSLSYLKRLPIHELKIDQSFVRDAPTDLDDAALVEAILSIANHLKLSVVAEGVETQAQADFLNARGSFTLQGYLYGKPEEANVWIQRWRAQGGHVDNINLTAAGGPFVKNDRSGADQRQ